VSDLRAAIIGYGLAGSVFHAPLIASTPGMAVASIVTANPERSAQAARDHPGAAVVPDVDEVLSPASEHDFAVIATPNESHAPLALRALDAGLAVVVDKPLAPGAAQARELVEHAEGLGLPLTVYLNRRWDSDQLTLRRLLEQGDLGTVLRHESRFERWLPQLRGHKWSEHTPPERGGGVLIDLGPHLVDQALQLFGPVVSVYAEIASPRGGAADDDAFLALNHASGTRSHLWTSAFTAAPGPRRRVLGDRAAFVVTDLDGQEDALRAGRRPGDGPGWGTEPPERWGRLVAGTQAEPVESSHGDWPAFYTGLWRALRSEGPLPVDPWDAVAGLEVLDAARRSAAERTLVRPGSG
jgi:scyllo-inositol 2-dehydrogenase (NADP+)